MTLLRSLIIGGLALVIARALCAPLGDRRPETRRVAWVLLLAPYFMPVLITGYAYASFSLSLIHHPVINTIFYSALLCWKFTPVAAVILYFTPAPISEESVHCWRLAHGGGSRVEGRGNVSPEPWAPPHPGPVDSLPPARSALAGLWLRPHSFRRFPSGSSLHFTEERERARARGYSILRSTVDEWVFLVRAGCARGRGASRAA